MKGIENRLVENGVEIIGTILDLGKLMMEDDTCFTHQEQIGQVTRFYKDIGELFAYLSGFDYKFDKVNMPKHIKKNTIKTAIHAFRKREHLKFKEIIKMDFPELYKIFSDINVELEKVMEILNQIFDAIDKIMDQFVGTVNGVMDGFTNEVEHTLDSVGAGISGVFAPPKHSWKPEFLQPQVPEFNQLPPKKQPFQDFGFNDLDRVFQAPQFPQFGEFKLF